MQKMFPMEKNIESFGDTGNGAKSELDKALESIFTIDGRGRPAKAKLFLLIMQKYSQDEVFKGIEEISKRKWF
jgi:hypothetical protein